MSLSTSALPLCHVERRPTVFSVHTRIRYEIS